VRWHDGGKERRQKAQHESGGGRERAQKRGGKVRGALGMVLTFCKGLGSIGEEQPGQ
jgi:hypothetical protein